MNDVTSTNISEEKENSETTLENFVKNLEIESIKDKLEDEC